MINLKKAAALPALAALALAALVGTGVSASAQNVYSNGPQGAQPDSLGGSKPHYVRRPAYRSTTASRRGGYRPLTVSRRRAAPVPPPVFAAAPVYNPYAGPGAIVTAPIAVGGTIASLPFRILGGIFPPVGPMAIIGAPIQAVGRIAQVPFQIAEAPFGGPGPFAY